MKKTIEYPDISVVVVNHNGRKYMERCLDSLRNIDYKKSKLEMLVVDNCSTDGSDDLVKKKFPDVKILYNDVNNYAKANNLGIKHSEGDFIALLNNDAYVDKNWLRELLAAIKNDHRAGCAGSKILFPDGRIQSVGHYEFPDFRWGDKGLREPDIGQYETPEQRESLSGCSVLFRRDCLKDVGGFDEDFVMFMEDVDIFWRCKKKNWKLFYAPKSVVYHDFHGSADEKLIRFYLERNRLLMVAKHFPSDLAKAIERKEHSLTQAELFKILPDVFLKLISSHGLNDANVLMEEFFAGIQRLYNLSKDSAVQQLNTLLNEERIMSNQLSKDADKKACGQVDQINNLQEQIKQSEIELLDMKNLLNEEKKNMIQLLEDADKKSCDQADQIKQHGAELLDMKNLLNEEKNRMIQLLEDADKKSCDQADQINCLQEQIKQSEAELLDMKNLLNEEKNRMIQLLEDADKKACGQADQINNLQEQIKQSEAELLDMKNLLNEEKKNMIQLLEKQIREHEALLSTNAKHEDVILNLGNEIESKYIQLKEKEGQIKEKEEQIKAINSARALLEEHLKAKEEENRVKGALLEDKESEIKSIVSARALLEEHLKAKEEENRVKDALLEDKESEIKSIVSARVLLEEHLKAKEEENRTVSSLKADLELRLERQIREQEESNTKYKNIIFGLGNEIEKKHAELIKLDKKMTGLLNSTTYKYIVIPLWRILDWFKESFNIKTERQKRILVVKPYNVSDRLTAIALHDLRNIFTNEEIILYDLDYNRLPRFGLLKLIYLFNMKYLDEAIVLIGPPLRHAYRKGKVITFFSGARRRKVYFIDKKSFAPLCSFNIKTAVFNLWRGILFFGIIVSFAVFVIIPLKIKKRFHR